MEDPVPTFTYLVQQLANRHPTLAYIHMIEPRVNGPVDRNAKEGEVSRDIGQCSDEVTLVPTSPAILSEISGALVP